MRQTRIKYTCDRCGLECFVDYAKIDKETRQYYDSGKESHPRDWAYIHGCYLCPDCEKIYTKLMEQFLNDAKQWYERIGNAQG